jgi:periplasmic protein TonB
MPKPLRSEDPRPRDMQFTHFGVLNTGSQSKTSLFTSVTINVMLGLICLIIGAATKKVVDNRNKEIALVVPLKEKPPEPPKPKLPPPPKLPDPPKVEEPKIEPPKIKLPDIPVPEPPKPVPVAAPKPMPVITQAPPKIQVAAAAPKVVSVTMAAKSASVVNNDPHPTAVALGNPNSPVPFQKSGPAVANVNLNRGMAGMPPENSGGGPRATKVQMGNGSPSGSIGGTAPVAVVGVPHGIIGGTGINGNGTGVQARQVQMATNAPPPQPVATHLASPLAHPPSVLYKPKPAYTAEASSLHIEGTVTVKLRVSASGAVTIVGVVAGLGHGLDQSAVTAAQGIRFKPATDASGNPVDWEGPVNIIFQIAS